MADKEGSNNSTNVETEKENSSEDQNEIENSSKVQEENSCNVQNEEENKGKSSHFADLVWDEECDQSCIHTIPQKLVRIQYPGIVKNLDKALDTLGGMKGVENGVAQDKLELNFHPDRKPGKGVIADKSVNSGLLVKLTKKQVGTGKPIWKYEVLGATEKNFVFTKPIDFQYLPLVAEFPETPESKAHYVHDSIIPEKIPDLDTVLKDDQSHIPLYLVPAGFCRSDIQQKMNPDVKPSSNNADSQSNKGERRILALVHHKQPSIFHKFDQTKIPEKPTQFISQLVSRRNYKGCLSKIEELFKERPIWNKNGLRYHSNLSNDLLKIVLPAVAYYELTGPWRCSWIRFGYDPRKDPESRKYQILDYRIPYNVRINLKIGSKRVSEAKGSTGIEDKSDKMKKAAKGCLDSAENSFTLRPNVLPLARQIFYQYCDILLPEIQTMLARLPPVSKESVCDPKIGWFPSSFVDQCREIVGKYVNHQAGSVLKKQREALHLDPFEDLFGRTTKLLEAAAGPSTKDDSLEDVLTVFDSDSDESDSEHFYKANNLYDLVDAYDNLTEDIDDQED